jgi:hypothetical protein
MVEQKTKEGWGFSPHLSKKWHYFVNGTSLCHKIGFFHGELEQGNDDSDENCTACKKILQKRKAKELVQKLNEGKKIEF